MTQNEFKNDNTQPGLSLKNVLEIFNSENRI